MGVVMNYEIKPRTSFVSTSLQGYIEASYADLVKVFGHPQCTETSGDGKIDLEWELKVIEEDGQVYPVTIYNWKDYDGGFAAMSAEKYRWHIGGKSFMSSAYINEYFENQTEVA
tara:strand:+ start:5697 stop:6038 length:342 start_codon:yes stop_codon:yes gene_type:complete